MLDSSQGLGFNLCTMPKCTLKIKPLFRFFHCEAWGSWLCSQPSLPSEECRPFFYLTFHTNWTLEASIVYSWILLGGPDFVPIESDTSTLQVSEFPRGCPLHVYRDPFTQRTREEGRKHRGLLKEHYVPMAWFLTALWNKMMGFLSKKT